MRKFVLSLETRSLSWATAATQGPIRQQSHEMKEMNMVSSTGIPSGKMCLYTSPPWRRMPLGTWHLSAESDSFCWAGQPMGQVLAKLTLKAVSVLRTHINHSLIHLHRSGSPYNCSHIYQDTEGKKTMGAQEYLPKSGPKGLTAAQGDSLGVDYIVSTLQG